MAASSATGEYQRRESTVSSPVDSSKIAAGTGTLSVRERRSVSLSALQTQGQRFRQGTPGPQVAGPIRGTVFSKELREPATTKVFFHTVNSEVQYGHSVRVVGNVEGLGSWDPLRGVTLSTNEDVFPCWVSQNAIFIPLHEEVEYKYVVFDSHGHFVSWEDYRGNRTFYTSGPEMTIEDDGGLFRKMLGSTEDDSDDEVGQMSMSIGMRTKAPPMAQLITEKKLAFIHDLEGSVLIGKASTVFMVALKLPVIVRKIGMGKDTTYEVVETAPTDGRNFAFLPLIQELRQKLKARVICVGWPGVDCPERERPRIVRMLSRHDCIPIWPPKQEFEKFLKFCHRTLWPIFHDVMLFFQTSNPRPFDETGWVAYQQINSFYASAIAGLAHENDMIWIHDYHLLMTPMCISRKFQRANIGFYLHTPFPSSDSFKSLPVREEILSGMLCADQVGFQFFGYARSFLVCLKRICGLDPIFRLGGFMGVEYGGRNVMIKVAHMPYPFEDTRDLILTDERIADKVAEVRRIFEGKIVFACMDREDGLSGLLPKFKAFKHFLSEHPQRRGTCVLVQYLYTSGEMETGQQKIRDALEGMADGLLKIDQDGTLQLEYKSVGDGEPSRDIFIRFDDPDRIDRLALFRAADVFLDNSVKAGLNLMPFEFISSHYDDSDEHAVVVISEFSGCSQVLLGSLRINPWNTEEIVAACERATAMGYAEKRERSESNLAYVSANSPMQWFQDFVEDLRRARKTTDMKIETIGFGAKVRHLCIGHDFVKLPVNLLLKAYRTSKNRVIFLDNEGTLTPDTRTMLPEYGAPKVDSSDLGSDCIAPDATVMCCLRALLTDSRNTVVVLSSRKRDVLEEWFGGVNRIGLCAEGGFYYKLPIATGDSWHCVVQNPDYTWKTYARQTMEAFAKRTQGSFIEDKGSAIAWQYRDANQHFGSWQAKELSSHLQDLLFGFDVDVNESKGCVEVKLRDIDKGVAVLKCLAKVAANFGEADFVLCVGDDRSDEYMFEAINAIADTSNEAIEEATSQMSTTDGNSDIVCDERNGIFGGSSRGHGCFRSSWTTVTRNVSVLSALGGGGFEDRASADQPTKKMRKLFTCTVGRKPSAANFFLHDTEEVSDLLVTLRSLHDRKQELSSYTWSGGDTPSKSMRASSVPALSSLSFPPATKHA
eukprot:TRINITY_DN4491_c0_g1_i1.p1 TRINITY_DN4491_c0_g1~~TRINITY_DN4491_c0_g1_i1.p1  ORF type:complete len:1163 (-),score=220.87 TRINITY_DN4491_c0_g1_i1:113-3601(-)